MRGVRAFAGWVLELCECLPAHDGSCTDRGGARAKQSGNRSLALGAPRPHASRTSPSPLPRNGPSWLRSPRCSARSAARMCPAFPHRIQCVTVRLVRLGQAELEDALRSGRKLRAGVGACRWRREVRSGAGSVCTAFYQPSPHPDPCVVMAWVSNKGHFLADALNGAIRLSTSCDARGASLVGSVCSRSVGEPPGSGRDAGELAARVGQSRCLRRRILCR